MTHLRPFVAPDNPACPGQRVQFSADVAALQAHRQVINMTAAALESPCAVCHLM